MPIREILLDERGRPAEIAENDSSVLSLELSDESGAFVPVATITTLKLTLYDLATHDPATPASGVIGLWDHRNILNANGGTVAESGAGADTVTSVTVQLAPADNPNVDPDKRIEVRVALIECKWSNDTKGVSRELEYRVVNLQKAPAA